MKKMIRKISRVISLLLLILLMVSFECMRVQAATGVTLTMTGFKVGDLVEIYRVASYNESSGSYYWESTVSDWIQNKSEGNAYKSLKPEQLEQMTKSSAMEFCQTLLVGLKNESKGIANLDGYTFLVGEEKQQYQVENVTPGYYMILPKGTDRIYELKWLKIAPDAEPIVNYEPNTQDYQIPTVTSAAENKTADRGKIKDGIFALEGDELEVSATISVPAYPDMYATGKRILNITVVVPQGLDYQKDSMDLSITDTSAYSVGEYEKATVYETINGEILFFGTPKGYYYELNGSLLVSNGTATEALEKYNGIHEKSYRLAIDESQTGNTEETESTEGTERIEQTESVETVEALVAEDDRAKLTAHSGRTVFVIALDTEQDTKEVMLHYCITKNSAANDTGSYDNAIALSYSVSPLDSNRTYSVAAQAEVSAYSITIVSCEGSGESINMTAAEKLEKAPRFSGVVFTLYRLKQAYSGDVTNDADTGQTEIGSTESTEPPKLIYDEKTDKTYEYTYVTSLTTNKKGIASIGGLAAADYLVEQTVYPSGYTLSDASLRIGKEAWEDETVMEGNEDLFVIWLEYKTRYLPGTGKQGTAAFVFLGSLLSIGALLILFRQSYPFGLPEIWEKRKKSEKDIFCNGFVTLIRVSLVLEKGYSGKR